jgi:uncharacterized membrane protein YfcA
LTLLIGFSLKQAAATSLAAISLTSIAGVIGYASIGGVVWLAALILAAGSSIGSFFGAKLLRVLPTALLTWFYVGLLVILGIRLFFATESNSGTVAPALTPWEIALLVALGLVSGVLAGLFGVGGGVMVVPILIVFLGFPSFLAKGTSLVMLIPASIIGTSVNLRNGMVDLKAALAIGVVAAAVSYAGVAVARVVPEWVSNGLFAVLILFTAAQFSIRTFRAQRAGRPID